MTIEVRNKTTDFNGYRSARVKSLFNAERGDTFNLDAELPIEDMEWQIGLIVGPSGTGKTSIGRAICDIQQGKIIRKPQDERFATFEPSTSLEPIYKPDLLMLNQINN